MKKNYFNDLESNWLLYGLIFLLSCIIIVNIGISRWQLSLESKYDAKTKETQGFVTEYMEKYNLKDSILTNCAEELEHIASEAKTIMYECIVAIAAEIFLFALTFLPVSLMYQFFKANRDIAYFRPSKTNSLILFFEIVINWISCISNVINEFEIIEKYQQLGNLIEDVSFTLCDANNYIIF